MLLQVQRAFRVSDNMQTSFVQYIHPAANTLHTVPQQRTRWCTHKLQTHSRPAPQQQTHSPFQPQEMSAADGSNRLFFPVHFEEELHSRPQVKELGTPTVHTAHSAAHNSTHRLHQPLSLS